MTGFHNPIGAFRRKVVYIYDKTRLPAGRKQHTPEEKARLALEAIRGEKTINETASDNDVHPNQISRWKKEAGTEMRRIFQDNTAKERKAQKERDEEVNTLYAQIGRLTTQIEWPKKNLASDFPSYGRRLPVDMKGRELPVPTQASLLGVDRSTLYCKKARPSEGNLRIKLLIDKIYARRPEYGCRRICWHLNNKDGVRVNHKAVLRHMREMGIQAIHPRQDTSKPNPENTVYPYLLKGLRITRPDQAWSIDVTYIPVKTGWLCLAAILDWYARFVLSWRLSDTLEIDFALDSCCAALRMAHPEIMNPDQGSHFTSPKYTGLFLDAGPRISMDHRGRAYDNISVERLWRTVK